MTARDQTAMRRLVLSQCQVCGGRAAHRHHIVPRSITQCDDYENLIGLCEDCHRRVHAKTIDLGLYLTPTQSAKAVVLLGTLYRAFHFLYPSESPKARAA